jgi:hypothetical protein
MRGGTDEYLEETLQSVNNRCHLKTQFSFEGLEGGYLNTIFI